MAYSELKLTEDEQHEALGSCPHHILYSVCLVLFLYLHLLLVEFTKCSGFLNSGSLQSFLSSAHHCECLLRQDFLHSKTAEVTIQKEKHRMTDREIVQVLV